MADIERLSFLAEWHDDQAGTKKMFQFMYFPSDGTVELFDLKNRRVFLRRTKVDTVCRQSLYLGSTVTVHGRHMKIVDYGDSSTKMKISHVSENTLAVIKPGFIPKLGDILQDIYQGGLTVRNMVMTNLTTADVKEFYAEHEGKPFYNNLINYMTSGPVCAMELMGDCAIARWRELLGPTTLDDAKRTAPNSIRGRFATDNTANACHGSDSSKSAARELEFYFQRKHDTSVDVNDGTCCIVKPHAVSSGQVPEIIKDIICHGFTVKSVKMFQLDVNQAEDFLEVYKGVVHEYMDMVNQLRIGPCIVMAITNKSGDAHAAFREFCGPADPEIAKHLKPDTLRARYGVDKVMNAVHCTDLPEDAPLELEFFFKLLSQ